MTIHVDKVAKDGSAAMWVPSIHTNALQHLNVILVLEYCLSHFDEIHSCSYCYYVLIFFIHSKIFPGYLVATSLPHLYLSFMFP